LTPGQRVVSAAGLNPSRSLVISQVLLAFGPSGPDPLLIHCRNRQVMGALEETVTEAEQKGADAVVGVDVDYESIQIEQGGSMLMVSASGPGVRL
jgi:Putative heavy-metal-binding